MRPVMESVATRSPLVLAGGELGTSVIRDPTREGCLSVEKTSAACQGITIEAPTPGGRPDDRRTGRAQPATAEPVTLGGPITAWSGSPNHTPRLQAWGSNRPGEPNSQRPLGSGPHLE